MDLSIFEDAGLSGGDSLFYQILIGTVNMVTGVLALLIIDKIGRKKLHLLWSLRYDYISYRHWNLFLGRRESWFI